jgi:DNA-binding NarL/FixJ family response regulator
MIRVQVISDAPAVRAGLRALLGATDDFDIIGEGDQPPSSGQAGLEPVPDVLVVDAGRGLELGDVFIGSDRPPAGIVLLGRLPIEHPLPGELTGRAWAYIPREATGDQLIAAIRSVAEGLVTIDPSLGGRLLDLMTVGSEPDSTHGEGELTAREREVLQLIAVGLANKQIATRLDISEHTVKFHVAALLSKLGAGSRTEAVHLAARRGLVAL